jgi:hypothetical protein
MNTIFLLTQTTNSYSDKKEPIRCFDLKSHAEDLKAIIERCNPRGTLEIIEVEYQMAGSPPAAFSTGLEK